MKKIDETQEIKLPRSKYEYGDNFEEEQNRPKEIISKKLKVKRLYMILSLIATGFIILLVIFICSFKNEGTNETTSTFTTISKTTESLKDLKDTEYFVQTETFEQNKETTVEKMPETTAQATQPTTIPVSQTTPVTEIVEETTISQTTPDIQVSDIFVYKDPELKSTIIIVNIIGVFNGYSEEELLSEVYVSSDSVSPSISLPHLEENSFSFNMDIEKCEGLLHINMADYDFYQSIDTII